MAPSSLYGPARKICESETAIYVRSGHPEFVFHDGTQEVRIVAAPGDYVFIPPYLPHREENPDPKTIAESLDNYANNYADILAAINAKIAPKWVLANVAGGGTSVLPSSGSGC